MFERKSLSALSVALLCSLAFSACSSDDAAQSLDRDEITASMVEDLDQEIADCVLSVKSEQGEDSEQAQKERVAELIKSCEEVTTAATTQAQAENEEENSGEELAFVGVTEYGDDKRLDGLWDSCEQGSGESCNELFSSSPIGSEYEKFGVSCGDRSTVLHCSELDKEDTKLVPKNAQSTTIETGEEEDAE